MAKKSFKTDNPALAFITQPQEDAQGEKYEQYAVEVQDTQEVHSTHDTQEVQDTHNTQEVQDTHNTQEVQHTQGTQGRKGHKLKRINMAFSDSNLEYLQIISRIEGLSITEYVNRLVAADQSAKAETVAKAKEILRGNK